MTQEGTPLQHITLEKGLATFLNALAGKNRSAATIRAYACDISQFISFLHATNVSIHTPADVQKIDIMEYLTACAKRVAPHLTVVRQTASAISGWSFCLGGRPRRLGGTQAGRGTW